MTGDLPAWLAWLRIPDCACKWEWRARGRNIPDGWVRATRTPDCPHHGSAAGGDRLASRA